MNPLAMNDASPVRAAPPRATLPAGVVAALVAGVVAALLAGCSGDDAAFLEAVEVRELSLADLSVAPPSRAPLPLTLSPGDSLDLDLLAVDAGGGKLDVDVVNRQWSVADPSIGSVDRNGRFTARGEGNTDVGLEIGGFVAAPLNVVVSRATLDSDPVVEGSVTPDRCVGTEYYATGMFSDSSDRLLTDASFSVPDGSGARLRTVGDDSPGVRRLVPTRAGPLTLSVTARGRSTNVELDVADSLQSIAIDPTSSGLGVRDTRNITATGTFLDANGTTRAVDVTDTIDFNLGSSDSQFGRISNLDDGTRGTFQALGAGNVTVNARCGDTVAAPFPIAIGASAGNGAGIAGGLSFDIGSSITLSLSRDQFNGQPVRLTSSRNGTGVTGNLSVTSNNQNVVQVRRQSNGVQTNGGLSNDGFATNGSVGNGLGNNGLGNNGLGNNGFTTNGLGNGGFVNNGLGSNGFTTNGLGNGGFVDNGFGNNGLGNGGSTITETVTLVPVGEGQAIVSASENGQRAELTVTVTR